MTSRETMRALIDQAYAARARGDVGELVAAFHEDAVFELAGSKKALDITGVVEGHPSLQQAMTDFVRNFEFTKRDILSFVADGDRAAVHSRLTVRYTQNGTTFTSDVLDLFTFRDGKIAKLVEFADTALIKEVVASAAN
jgi:ketosteroid isomerase-like protein